MATNSQRIKKLERKFDALNAVLDIIRRNLKELNAQLLITEDDSEITH